MPQKYVIISIHHKITYAKPAGLPYFNRRPSDALGFLGGSPRPPPGEPGTNKLDALGFLGGSPGTPTVYRATNNRRLTDAWLLAGDSNYYIYGLNGYDE